MKCRKGDVENILVGLVAIAVVLVILVLPLQPYFEMKSFNKFRPEGTPKATYWDALWADLRVTSE